MKLFVRNRARRIVPFLLAMSTFGAAGMIVSCSGDSGTGPVVVPPKAVTRVDVSTATSTITNAQTVQLSATARASDGSTIASSFTWVSSATNVATVDASGLVTGVSAGTALLSATVGSVTGAVTITVTAAAGVLNSVAATITDGTIQLGQFTRASVTGRDGVGTAVALGLRVVSWSSTNATIATVSAIGTVTGVGVGSTTVNVAVQDGAVSRTASVPVTVTSIPGAPTSADVFMPGLTFSAFQTIVKVGGTVRFVFPPLAHNVFWDVRLPGSPADINTTSNQTVPRVFATSGVFHYKCTLHNGMEGDVVVTP